jgi:hypothetical protein
MLPRPHRGRKANPSKVLPTHAESVGQLDFQRGNTRIAYVLAFSHYRDGKGELMTEASADANQSVAEPPEANTDVVAHDQGLATSDINIGMLTDRDQPGLPGSSLGGALDLLVADNDVRRSPGLVILALASAWAKESTARHSTLEHRNGRLGDELAKAREENAALVAKDSERGKFTPLVTVALMAGPTIIGIGLNQLPAEHWGTAALTTVIGIAILGAALWTRRGDRK